MASRSMASLLAWLPALAVAAANDCDVAVVGGGWAGLYTAYRLAPTTPNLCLFEARHKTGGRTYSVREEHNLTIDIGAYRFGRDMHLPGDLIRFDLNLSTRCYQPDRGLDRVQHDAYKIVDGDAAENAAGYETPLRLITRDLVARGVRVEYGRELAGAALLNLPRKAITALDAGDSPLFRYDATAAGLAPASPARTQGFEVEQLKVYLVYPEPWWRTELGILEGSFAATNSSPPFFGRFHDGPMLRTPLARFVPSITYYDAYRAAGDDPLTVSTNATLLAESHAAARFTPISRAPTGESSPPTPAVMGFWDASNKFLPTPMSSNFRAMLKTPPGSTAPTTATASAL
ncbi:flavin containing amine oxidoreductase [Aureococcus anophagefferens]|nr:flavin containing amine oxidoreductase [Aureococcus anophagefferens]